MKIIKGICAIVLVIALLPLHAFAIDSGTQAIDFIYFDDGSYMTITLIEQITRAGNEKSATKTYRYYSTLDIELWSATLSATFSFDGTEYWATASSISTEVLNNSWYVISESATHSGCGATGNVTMGKKLLGVTVSREDVTITLSCSPYGVIS